MNKRFVFFFKQKTAYEMLRSLVGSEMCIRDRVEIVRESRELEFSDQGRVVRVCEIDDEERIGLDAVSYTHLTLPTIYSV